MKLWYAHPFFCRTQNKEIPLKLYQGYILPWVQAPQPWISCAQALSTANLQLLRSSHRNRMMPQFYWKASALLYRSLRPWAQEKYCYWVSESRQSRLLRVKHFVITSLLCHFLACIGIALTPDARRPRDNFISHYLCWMPHAVIENQSFIICFLKTPVIICRNNRCCR